MGHFKQKSSCGLGGLTVTFKDESARRLLPKIGKLKKTLYFLARRLWDSIKNKRGELENIL